MNEQASIAGVRIDLLRRGRGRPLLFLHDGDGVEPSLGLLDRLAQSFDVVAPSLPGFGASELPRQFSTSDDLAYFCLDLLDALDLRDVLLVGASFGAWVAMQLAVKNATRLSALVLSGPLGVKFGDRERRDILDVFAILPQESAPYLYAAPEAFTPDYAEAPAEVLERMARNRESYTLYGWAPTLYDPKLRQRLHRITVPTLVLWGEADRVVNREYAAQLAGCIPAARLAVVQGAGHYAHVERAEIVAGEIAAFAAAAGGQA